MSRFLWIFCVLFMSVASISLVGFISPLPNTTGGCITLLLSPFLLWIIFCYQYKKSQPGKKPHSEAAAIKKVEDAINKVLAIQNEWPEIPGFVKRSGFIMKNENQCWQVAVYNKYPNSLHEPESTLSPETPILPPA
jgi:hypothetical protein